MRILLSHVYAWPEVRRGGERYLHELGAALAGAGHDVSIISTAPTPGRDRVLGVDVTYLPRRPWLRRYRELSVEACFGWEVLGRRGWSRLDVWHALGTADAAAASRLSGMRRGVRSVYTDLGNPLLAWRSSRPDAALHRRVVASIDEYVCLSDFAGRLLRDDFGRRARVIGAGVDTARFTPSAPRTDTPTLLFSGDARDERKNLSLLVAAAQVLRDDGVPVEVVATGPSDPPAQAPSWVRYLGVGGLDALPALYSSAWATVLPSVHEAFGLALVESLACGTPVVALREGGGPAALVTPGVGALAAGTPADLAAACRTALDLAASGDEVRASCRAAALPYDWNTGIAPQVLAAYAGTLSPRC